MITLRTNTHLLIMAITVILLAACEEEPRNVPPDASQQEPETVLPSKNTKAAENPISQQFMEESIISWQQVIDATKELNTQTKRFLVTPTQAHLEKTLTSWEQAHTYYLATRFYDHVGFPELVIVHEDPERIVHSLQVRIDQYPLIPGYLDAVNGYPQSGLVYGEQPFTEVLLEREHQLGDTAYVAMGFHALRFILEGDPATGKTVENRFMGKDESVRRRQLYVTLLSELLLQDIEQLAYAWIKPEGYYSKMLDKMSSQEQVKTIQNAIEVETSELESLQKQTSEHITADVITLRAARLNMLRTP